MKPIITPLYFSLFFFILTLLVAAQYKPVDDITIACGDSGTLVNRVDPRTWIGDINSKFSPIEVGKSNTTSKSRKAPPSPSTSQPPYTTARFSHSEFTYKIPLSSPGQKFIRLHFNPASYPDFDRSNSLFSVIAGGFTLLQDFNASVTADVYDKTPLIREFCVNVETEQSLNITFTPAKAAYAFINGIEIVSMPTSLYYTSSAKFIGSEIPYPIGNNTALEMVYRINVGGNLISPDLDTGMYRSWDNADERYLDNVSRVSSILPQNNTIELNFMNIPEYSAPKAVYLIGRSTWTIFNLTWVFPLDPKFNYLVRLHFCAFEFDFINFGDQSFQIYMANQTAEVLADVIGWSRGQGNPVYRDYVVGMFMPPVGSRKNVDLFLVLAGLQRYSSPSYSKGMLNGLEIFKLSNSIHSLAGPNPDPIKVTTTPKASPNSPNKENSIPIRIQKKEKSIPMAAIIAGVVSSILVFSVLGYLVFGKRWKVKDSGSGNRRTKLTMIPASSLPSYLCRYFPLVEIKAATKNFNDTFIIGAGGFGNVYKGCIDGGTTLVAIKRLKPESSQGAHEFKTEIEMLSQLRHRHLVSLIGYCVDKGEMILVYDYMARGTLRDHLYHTNNPPLPWEQRLQICIGTARGLQYLHSGAKGTIIHRDVKSTNILLDDKWVAKVSDFGLSKGTNNMSKTHISTVVKGSFGYLDPEYYRRQRLTEKSDVYSLGVVLFEVLCARPAVIQTEELKQVSLAEWAKSCHQNGELDQIIDPSLRGRIADECLNRFTEVAINCMHDNGTERPSMTDVVKELELALQLQQRAEENINHTERNVETETSSSEQSCATNDSIKCISATIFSEINDPCGR